MFFSKSLNRAVARFSAAVTIYALGAFFVSVPATLQAQPSTGVVLLGDTLLTIARRYDLTMMELLRFNPGLDTARLFSGMEIRLTPPIPEHTQTIKREPTTFSYSFADYSYALRYCELRRRGHDSAYAHSLAHERAVLVRPAYGIPTPHPSQITLSSQEREDAAYQVLRVCPQYLNR